MKNHEVLLKMGFLEPRNTVTYPTLSILYVMMQIKIKRKQSYTPPVYIELKPTNTTIPFRRGVQIYIFFCYLATSKRSEFASDAILCKITCSSTYHVQGGPATWCQTGVLAPSKSDGN